MPINVVKLDDRKLREMIATSPTKAKRILRQSAFQVEAWAKERVPRDPARPPQDPSVPVTGNLRNSINATFENSEFTAIVQDGVEYGIYQELGTSRIPARPWLVPAVEKMAKIWKDKWSEIFK